MNSSSSAGVKSRNVNTVLHSKYQEWELDFITSSFYLPLEVLTDSRFTVAPIRLITGDQYAALAAMAEEDTRGAVLLANDGASRRMLMAAKTVGVSERLIKATGVLVLICKIWYGSNGAKEFA